MLRPIPTNTPVKAASRGNKKHLNISLKQGSLIKGIVIQKLRDGNFIISSGGKTFRAHSASRLENNKNYDFIVLSSRDKIELKVLEPYNRVTGNMTDLVPSANVIGRALTDSLSLLVNSLSIKNPPSHLSGLIQKLQDIINFPALKNEIPEILTWVTKNIQGSGIFWETKVLRLLTGKKVNMRKEMADTDLKALLLKLIKNIENNAGDQRDMKAVSMKASEVLNLIEQEQIMNLDTIREDLGWFVHMPIINDDDFFSSEFFVKENKDGKLHFSLFLDMSLAGKMKIDVSMIKDTVGIRIEVQKEETKGFITESIGELEDAFKNMGIKIGAIYCEFKEKIPVSDTLAPAINSSVDLVI